MKKLLTLVMIVAFSFGVVGTSFAAPTWFGNLKVKQATATIDGTVNAQVSLNNVDTWVSVSAAQAGANSIYATLLTAISLGYNVNMRIETATNTILSAVIINP